MQFARNELRKYQNVTFTTCKVSNAQFKQNHFELTLSDGRVLHARKLLLATGVIDEIPKIKGITQLFGKSVFNCPYCDGWEVRHKKIVVYGKAERGFTLAKSLKTWSNDIILCTNGPAEIPQHDLQILHHNNIPVIEHKIEMLEGENGILKKVVFENRDMIDRDAMFFNTESIIRSRLLEQLKCHFSDEDGVQTEKYERTNVPGLFVAGNILKEVQLVIVAAAQGAEAAFGINGELARENLRLIR